MKDYKDKSTLYELYHGEGLDAPEIAKRLNCSSTTVYNWMDKLGVPKTRAHDFPQYLKWAYVNKGREQERIAEDIGVDQTTISRRLIDSNLKTRHSGHYQPPSLYHDENGYYTCRTYNDGTRVAVRVHRLAAVAWFGLDAVAGNHIHHKNGVAWDNRECNLEPINPSEHIAKHHEQGDIRPPQLRD